MQLFVVGLASRLLVHGKMVGALQVQTRRPTFRFSLVSDRFSINHYFIWLVCYSFLLICKSCKKMSTYTLAQRRRNELCHHCKMHILLRPYCVSSKLLVAFNALGA